MKVLTVDNKKCIGCRICEQWCSMSHFGVVNPAKARIRVTRIEEKGIDFPTICIQCTKPACIKSCPEGALKKDEKTGAVKIKKDICTGCRLCMEACPRSAVGMHPTDGYVLICDLCHGKPKCVENCPEGALQYVEKSAIDRLYRSKLINSEKEGSLDE